MFETHENGRRKLFFAIPGEHYWEYVGVLLQTPWFYVTCEAIHESGVALHQSLMLSDVKQLLDLSRRKDVNITFIDIMSPGYMNESGRWKMEPLKEIWLRVNAECPEQYEHVFILEDGNSRIEMAVPPENKSLTEEKIFSL